MNWLQKMSQSDKEIYETFGDVSEWHDGELAILSSFGWRDFSVVEILSWNNVPLLNDKYKASDEDTIQSDVYSWKRNESVPFKILSTYSDSPSGKSRYHTSDTIRLAGPQNLYKSLDDLIQKELRSIYPDLVISLLNSDHISSFIKDYPELIKDKNLLSHIDYDIFEHGGYEIQILNDHRQIERNPGIMKTRGTEGIYYWHIPELNTRSLDHYSKKDIDIQPWGTGRYPTMKLALNSAEKYIDHLFYSKG